MSGRLSINVDDNGDGNSRPLIRKVPWMLREHKKVDRYFEPRAVAIGPLHHHNCKYKPAEAFKERLKFIFVQGSCKTEEFLHQIIKKEIQTLKACYDTEDFVKSYSDDKLARILFVDGCAALQFMRSKVHQELKSMHISNNLAAFAEQDVFLLENQLPFEVLELLMQNHRDGKKYRESIQNFIRMSMVVEPKQKPEITSALVHLLDLLRTSLLAGPPKTNKDDRKSKGGQIMPTFRSITELKAAGIVAECSSTSCLKDVDFQKQILRGRMKLPPMIVDDSTGPKFLNLVAYEMCPDFTNESEISSYVCLMDSLIDKPEDVKELRKAKVLHNLLGSDAEVAELFNDISTAYYDFKKKIQDHCDAKWNTWITEGYHNHFSSPWTCAAFFAAFAGLGLSFLQVWAAFDPGCQQLCNSNL